MRGLTTILIQHLRLISLRRPEDTPEWQRSTRPHTPSNALLSGPAVGGPWSPGDSAPRAVRISHFDLACPEAERYFLDGRRVRDAVRGQPAMAIFDHYVKVLEDEEARCIEIVSTDGDLWAAQVFGFSALATERGISLMQAFVDMESSRLLKPSKVVEEAVRRNKRTLAPMGARVVNPMHDQHERMMAVHVRRSDFSWVCEEHARWARTFYGWYVAEFTWWLGDPHS